MCLVRCRFCLGWLKKKFVKYTDVFDCATNFFIFHYSSSGVAEKAWKRLLYWISHCRLKPMISVGKMIRKYFWGILNAIRLKSNNSMLEAKNARIQRIKKVACGFRNKERFKNAILFHLGGLELMPSSTR
ncbi:MAG: transposase [Bacteroidales bacterium]|nr:transposase [Bacteroidales bacterium]